MARTKKVVEEVRNPGSEPMPVVASPPVAGQSLHYAIASRSLLDASEVSFMCAGNPKGRRVVVVAPLDDPRWCPKCLKARPGGHGSEIRILTVLHTL
jgi:hypothetical protein